MLFVLSTSLFSSEENVLKKTLERDNSHLAGQIVPVTRAWIQRRIGSGTPAVRHQNVIQNQLTTAIQDKDVIHEQLDFLIE